MSPILAKDSGRSHEGTTSRPHRRKTTGRRNLAKRAFLIWSRIIRAGGRCARCKRTTTHLFVLGLRLEAAHIIRRWKKTTAFHLKGGIPLCGPYAGTCHYWFDNEASDLERAEFAIAVVGRATYDELHRMKNETWDKDYDRILAELHAEMKRLGIRDRD